VKKGHVTGSDEMRVERLALESAGQMDWWIHANNWARRIADIRR